MSHFGGHLLKTVMRQVSVTTVSACLHIYSIFLGRQNGSKLSVLRQVFKKLRAFAFQPRGHRRGIDLDDRAEVGTICPIFRTIILVPINEPFDASGHRLVSARLSGVLNLIFYQAKKDFTPFFPQASIGTHRPEQSP